MAKKRQSAQAAAKGRPGKASSARSSAPRKAAPAAKNAAKTVKKKTAAKSAPRKAAPPARQAAAKKPAARPAPRKPVAQKPAGKAAKPSAAKSRRTAADDKAQAAAPPAPPAPRKPGFYEAVAVYERGVQALQRHDYEGAAAHFRTVLDKYPGEQELLERARLYLRVCERETERRPAAPKTPAERVYAATVALNSGDHTGALDHLQRALGDDPDSDHAHYIMAVALGMRSRHDEALDHLRRAIALNPDNRGLAREDPDLESLRSHQNFEAALNTPAAPGRRRSTRRS